VERAVINSYELTRKIQKYAEVRSTINVDADGEAHLGQLLFEIDIEHYQGRKILSHQPASAGGVDITVKCRTARRPGISINLQE
jgi:predicted RNA binding protein with dsRBD fold (UPF0201 family)